MLRMHFLALTEVIDRVRAQAKARVECQYPGQNLIQTTPEEIDSIVHTAVHTAVFDAHAVLTEK
jgi:hypothetical protein